MKILFIIILAFIYILFAFIGERKFKNFFHPSVFFNIYGFLTDIPRLLTINNLFLYGEISDNQYLNYFIIKLIYVITVNIVLINSKYSSKFIIKDKIKNPKKFILFIYISFFIGLISELSKIYYIGGLENLYRNMGSRTEILSGSGLFSLFTILLPISVSGYMIYINKTKKSTQKRIAFILMFLITTILMLSLGSRTSFIRFILILIFVYNFNIKKIKIRNFFKFRYISLTLFLFVFIISIPQLRLHSEKDLTNNIELWFQLTIKDSERLIRDISSVDRDIFTIDYFSNNEKWNGRNYLDLIYVPIPRNIIENKPPKDDGVYLENLIQGFDVQTNTGYNDFVYKSSAPWSNVGVLFGNFGIFGIILGGLLYGKIITFIYSLMKMSDKNFILVYSYSIIITQFSFSNLQIVNVFLLITIPLLLYLFVNKQRLYRRETKSFSFKKFT